MGDLLQLAFLEERFQVQELAGLQLVRFPEQYVLRRHGQNLPEMPIITFLLKLSGLL